MNTEELIKLNSSGYTQREMAKILNVNRTTIQRHLKKLGLSTPNYHNKLKFDNTVFDDINTEEKAYWLGFLYADGSVSSTNNNVEISLKGEDIEHLNKYKQFLKHSSEVKIGISKCAGKIFSRCRFCVTDKYFKKRLIELGCIPNKSLTLSFPDLSIFSSPELVYSFIRGYVDGDGCISFTKDGKPTLEIVGTKEFLSGIKNIFPNSFGNVFIKDKRRPNGAVYIKCTRKKAKFVLEKLYDNSSIYLQRKYNRFAVLSSNW